MDYNLKNFGKIIRIERIKNDLSQEKLAELLNVSMRTISLIESGKQHPKFFLVVQISKILNFDLNILKQ